MTNTSATAETITITCRVVVLDTLANQTEVTLSNNLVMTQSSGSLSKQAPAQTTIQPILPMAKTVNQVKVDPGQP